jgi:hypothetical protein
MTRHTLRDLAMAFQGALICLALYALYRGNGWAVVVLAAAVVITGCIMPSRLPPRDERGRFSKGV